MEFKPRCQFGGYENLKELKGKIKTTYGVFATILNPKR